MWTPLPSTGTGTAKKPSGRPHIDHFNFIISLLLFLSNFFCYTQFFGKQIEDITCPRVDMNFIFEWSTRYISRVSAEHLRLKGISHRTNCKTYFRKFVRIVTQPRKKYNSFPLKNIKIENPNTHSFFLQCARIF